MVRQNRTRGIAGIPGWSSSSWMNPLWERKNNKRGDREGRRQRRRERRLRREDETNAGVDAPTQLEVENATAKNIATKAALKLLFEEKKKILSASDKMSTVTATAGEVKKDKKK